MELVSNNEIKEKSESDVEIAFNEIKPKLEKTVSVLGGIGLVVGSIIGSGIFLSPSDVYKSTGSIGLFLIVWVLCGIFALLGSLCYVELGTEIPLSGGEYSYLREAIGPISAFLFSWTSTLIIRPSAVAIISMIFAEYVSKPFYDDGVVPTYVIKIAAFACIRKLCFYPTIVYVLCSYELRC